MGSEVQWISERGFQISDLTEVRTRFLALLPFINSWLL